MRTNAPRGVLLLWVNGFKHDFSTDQGFELVVGIASGGIELQDSAAEITRHLVPR